MPPGTGAEEAHRHVKRGSDRAIRGGRLVQTPCAEWLVPVAEHRSQRPHAQRFRRSNGTVLLCQPLLASPRSSSEIASPMRRYLNTPAIDAAIAYSGNPETAAARASPFCVRVTSKAGRAPDGGLPSPSTPKALSLPPSRCNSPRSSSCLSWPSFPLPSQPLTRNGGLASTVSAEGRLVLARHATHDRCILLWLDAKSSVRRHG